MARLSLRRAWLHLLCIMAALGLDEQRPLGTSYPQVPQSTHKVAALHWLAMRGSTDAHLLQCPRWSLR